VGVTRGGVAWRSRDSCGPIKNLCNRTNVFTLLACTRSMPSSEVFEDLVEREKQSGGTWDIIRRLRGWWTRDQLPTRSASLPLPHHHRPAVDLVQGPPMPARSSSAVDWCETWKWSCTNQSRRSAREHLGRFQVWHGVGMRSTEFLLAQCDRTYNTYFISDGKIRIIRVRKNGFAIR